MRDPYEVLGVPRNASAQQVKEAYRKLARKYHPDNYIDSPLADNATRKMQEINEAYDAIVSGNAKGSYYSQPGYSSDESYKFYQQVNDYISQGRLDEAEAVLEAMPNGQRNARWYYLKGQINYQRGWTDQAFTYFTTAHNMDPHNAEYTHAYENLSSQRSGGYRTRSTNRSSGSDCGICDICSALLCADCCCECMGGDFISCC